MARAEITLPPPQAEKPCGEEARKEIYLDEETWKVWNSRKTEASGGDDEALTNNDFASMLLNNYATGAHGPNTKMDLKDPKSDSSEDVDVGTNCRAQCCKKQQQLDDGHMRRTAAHSRIVTMKAPVNIAVVKYWGKRDETLNLPMNGSISVTLGLKELCAKTTVASSKKFSQDRFWLNGREQDLDKNPRILKCLKEIRRLAKKRKLHYGKELARRFVHICSYNNFPTAAGMASSAAGFACLVSALSKVHVLEGDVSHITRQGSGSACRSLYGGFVKWNKGEKDDGLDSTSMQIVPEDHWPELRCLILVINDQQKKTGSTVGMQRSAVTSELLKYRVESIVPERMKEMEEAIRSRDFTTFAHLTMKESNQFHAVCLDTLPPITYLNQTSHRIIQLITILNDLSSIPKAAYTFDAGPNAFVFTTSDFVAELVSLLTIYFGPKNMDGNFIRGISLNQDSYHCDVIRELERRGFVPTKGDIQYIIHTKVGSGPEELDESESLLDENGQPILETQSGES